MNSSNMSPVQSYSVNASAGFGKTEDLTLRIITILLRSDSPETTVREIVAMTFTRAAAGEIYERLLSMAYRALTEDDGVEMLQVRIVIAQTIKELGEAQFIQQLDNKQFQAELQAKRFQELSPRSQEIYNSIEFCTTERLTKVLKVLVQNMTTIKMSTIDSFMYNIVATFPFELGLPGRAELIEAAESRDITNQLLTQLFNLATTDNNKSDYVEACREILNASNNKNVFEVFEEIVNNLAPYSAYVDDLAKWDHFNYVSNNISEEELKASQTIWQNFILSEEYNKKANAARSKGYVNTCQAIAKGGNLQKGNNFTKDEQSKLDEIFSDWQNFPKPSGSTFINKLDPYLQDAAKILLSNIADFQIRQASRATASMRILIEEYNNIYNNAMAQSGKITFGDIPKLLNVNRSDWVYDINFRLNSKYKHWLIDEFQDTNFEQLNVVNEIINNIEEEENSLYLVGDVKQAIYSWRGGDRHLMGLEAEQFDLTGTFLPFSYRYGRNICDALNSIFDLSKRYNSIISVNFSDQWSSIWRKHYPASNTSDGIFEVIAPNFYGPNAEEKIDLHATVIAQKIEEFNIFESGLNTAILVRNRKTGIQLRELLAFKFPDQADRFIWEGDETIGSDPLVAGLLSLFVYLHHPNDQLCLGTVKMNQVVRQLLPADEESWAEQLHEISTLGFHGTLLNWLKKLHNISVITGENRSMNYSAANNSNISTLLLAAQNFDSSTIVKDAIKFRDFVLEYKRQDSVTTGCIKIMTIHKSKGLTFDAVFVPIVNIGGGKAINWRSLTFNRLCAKIDSTTRELDWLIYAPKKAANTVPELVTLAEDSRDDAIFEEFCLTYVALTRAKKIAVALLPPLSKEKFACFEDNKPICSSNSSSYYMSDFLFDASFYEQYDGDIIDGNEMLVRRYGEKSEPAPQKQTKAEKAELIMPLNLCSGQGRIPRATPAHSDDSWANLLRLPEVDSSANFGLQLHKFFEEVGNLAEYQPQAELSEKLAEHIGNCQANPEICQLISTQHSRVWQETAFELILEKRWITGRFDRVNITEVDGKVVSAEVIDFKSDFIKPDVDLAEHAERHRSQLTIYRKAAAQLLNLPITEVKCKIIFSHVGKIVEL